MFLLTVPEEVESSGARDRGGKAGVEALLPQAHHHQGAVQGDLEEVGAEGKSVICQRLFPLSFRKR